jgi:Family of unknown function (DUF6519)
MEGDFSRITFNKSNQYSRVLMQQGRVLDDADLNEQAEILNHALRTLITDLAGPHWGTVDGDMAIDANNAIKLTKLSTDSFKIDQLMKKDGTPVLKDGTPVPNDFAINSGHYYVDGLPCVNEQVIAYSGQGGFPDKLENSKKYLVYLETWERPLSYLEDINMREIALGMDGPDTAERAKVVWQVKTPAGMLAKELAGEDLGAFAGKTGAERVTLIEALIKKLEDLAQPANRGYIKARAKAPTSPPKDPCTISPDARYRGTENQLYRVEIHKSGPAGTATFKWSRENGSVVFPILKLEGNAVRLGNLGRDDRLSLTEGDWVEIVNDDYILQISGDLDGKANPLLQVVDVDHINMVVTLSGKPAANLSDDQSKHLLLRRWDQKGGTGKRGEPPKLSADGSGTVTIQEAQASNPDTNWITLEDGIQIQFQRPSAATQTSNAMYRTGDYWLIPARTVRGDILWPQQAGEDDQSPPVPMALPPDGVDHHYALLAIVPIDANGNAGDANDKIIDLRYLVPPLGKALALVLQFP